MATNILLDKHRKNDEAKEDDGGMSYLTMRNKWVQTVFSAGI